MKSRENALRLKRFTADECARKVADLEYMVREFEQMAQDLDRQIHAEEERTGIRDSAHFAYSTFAKAASQRRNNLRNSVADLQVKLDSAVQERDRALADLERSGDNDRPMRRHDRGASALLR